MPQEKVNPEQPKKPAPEVLNEFLKKENLALNAYPEFMARDDGTFSVVVRLTVDYKK